MNISYNEFMNMTPYEFSVSLKVYKRKVEQAEIALKYRFQFDRLMTIASLNPHIKHPIKDVVAFFEFYWEKGEGGTKIFEDITEVDVNKMFNLTKGKENGREQNSSDIDNKAAI